MPCYKDRSGRERAVWNIFLDETISDPEGTGKVIERTNLLIRSSIWRYFTVDDGQMDLT